MTDFEFISVRFTRVELDFIRQAFPNRATVEAIELAALTEAGRRIREISDAEKLLRDYRGSVPAEPAPPKKPTKARPPARERKKPLAIPPKREGEIDKAARSLRAKMDGDDEAQRRKMWAELGSKAFEDAGRKHA